MKKYLFFLVLSLFFLGDSVCSASDSISSVYEDAMDRVKSYEHYPLKHETDAEPERGFETIEFNPVSQYKNIAVTFDQSDVVGEPVEVYKPVKNLSPSSFALSPVHSDLFLNVSHEYRTRLGIKFTFGSWYTFTPYSKIAWEQEYENKDGPNEDESQYKAPSLKEASGVGEIGFSWESSKIRNLFLNMAFQGYVGKREGIGGILQFRKVF